LCKNYTKKSIDKNIRLWLLIISLALSFQAKATDGVDAGPVYNVDLDMIIVNLKQPSNKKHLIINTQLILKSPIQH